jgi:WD40 repeat protein
MSAERKAPGQALRSVLALHRDLATGNHLRILTGHTGQVRGVAFSPDGRLLATGSGDGSAWLWD